MYSAEPRARKNMLEYASINYTRQDPKIWTMENDSREDGIFQNKNPNRIVNFQFQLKEKH